MKTFEPWVSPTIYAGQRYGRYVVLSTHRAKGTYTYYAYCQCDCGSPPRYVLTSPLRNGESESCGCLHKERVTKHGSWKHPLFGVWRAMMSRCYNASDKRFDRYGERGIDVCSRWHDVNCFLEDMAASHRKGLTLDRMDNHLGYSLDNCRWATTAQQNRNYSRNVMLTHDGKTLCMTDWAALTGINYGTLIDRLKRGWPTIDILTKPAMSSKESSAIARHVRWNVK